MEELLVNHNNGITTITLNRPAVFNSFNRSMALALHAALDNAANDEAVRCIVLTGEGRAFCAGQDLGEVIDPAGPGLPNIVHQHYNPIIRRLRTIEKPIIAAVNGVAAGAGANIALACDICVAKASATFIQAFSKIGLVPDSGGTWMLPRLIGLQRATALAMLGEKVAAADAMAMGMIFKAVADDDFEQTIANMSTQLANMPTKALGMTKRAFNMAFENDLNTQLDLEGELQTAAGQTHDYKEGVAAFIEKRKPAFIGQ
jgi:2-(1,2-epoxy-1,2-dihydrophenyl)acetyl-CoA isomerase